MYCNQRFYMRIVLFVRLVSYGFQYISKLIRRWNKLAKISIFNAAKYCVCALKKTAEAMADVWQREFDATICDSEKKRKSSVYQTNKQHKKKVDPIKWQRKLLHRQSAMEFWVESVFFFGIQRAREKECGREKQNWPMDMRPVFFATLHESSAYKTVEK